MPPRGQAGPGQFAAKAEQTLGIIPGTKLWTPFPFAGLNYQDAPTAIDDKEFSYLLNYFRLGSGLLRAGYDASDAFFTAPHFKTIVYFFWYNIGFTDYVAVFYSDGTADQVQQSNGAVTPISAVTNTFPNTSGSLPVCSQWGSQYLLIAHNNAFNGYFIWDGTLLYQAGTAGPVVDITSDGANYTTMPTVTPYGGSGSGIEVSTTVINGNVTNVVITNPGMDYEPGDQVQLQFAGGGSDTAAILIAQLSGGTVASVTVTAGGSAYTAPTVQFSAPTMGGTVATGTVQMSGGVITGVTLTNPGSGYTEPPNVAIIDPTGTGALAQAFLSISSVRGVDVVNGGTNYTFPPTLTIQGGGGQGAQALAVLTPTSLSSVAITNGGGPYTSVPTVVFNNAGTGGSGAAATAFIENGQVVGATLTDAGSGYTIPPYITFTGGGLPTNGVTATATAYLTGTSIASVIMSNQGTGYTTQPAVVITPGANNAASAMLEMMPFGVSGRDLETFNGRVWLAFPYQRTSVSTGGVMLVSAPQSLTDFATSDGGVIFTNGDRFLKSQFGGLRQSNGYLYAFGDDSASVISNVQTTGSPATTTFTFSNVDPQIGLAWRDAQQDYSRTIIVANQTGIYGLYGGAMTNVSAKIQQLFNRAVFQPTVGAVTPCAAVADIFNVRHYFLLISIIDPIFGELQTVMLGWNGQTWGVYTQQVNLLFIGSQEINSKLTAWGTDGRSIYQLFEQPSTTLLKLLQTKYYGTDSLLMIKDFLNLYLQGQDTSMGGSGITMTANFIVSGQAVQPPLNDGRDLFTVPNAQYSVATYPDALFSQPGFFAPSPFFPVWGNGTGGFSFLTMGLQLGSTSPDFILSNLAIAYQDNTAYQ